MGQDAKEEEKEEEEVSRHQYQHQARARKGAASERKQMVAPVVL
jgi:hypothetical protein